MGSLSHPKDPTTTITTTTLVRANSGCKGRNITTRQSS
jgi:hypothetical protein